ncbi:hypothetical protein [Bacillus weihaiensis]|uniref:DUF5659 domain-containing protein n=1 Tax=Bacillus weihaiensis TaxID=1547283 RepID=A0A1L3MU61_9BACI|nr:hypothetical protein [Bacillus weihaiensis]APH05854.1 hypothetical protein A9C19_14540 [Bacillus weihaiensis]
MNKSDFFFVYNKRVSDFLKTKGINFICVAIEPKSQKMFSLYYINDDLQKALAEYKQLNN